MKETNYWQQFLHTGKVEDYLKYRGTKQGQTQQSGSIPHTGDASFTASFLEAAESGRQDGAGYAGMRGSDGNGNQGRAGWGV